MQGPSSSNTLQFPLWLEDTEPEPDWVWRMKEGNTAHLYVQVKKLFFHTATFGSGLLQLFSALKFNGGETRNCQAAPLDRDLAQGSSNSSQGSAFKSTLGMINSGSLQLSEQGQLPIG